MASAISVSTMPISRSAESRMCLICDRAFVGGDRRSVEKIGHHLGAADDHARAGS